MNYFRELPKDDKGLEIRREVKAIVTTSRCPGCNWVPQWKSACGPFPLQRGDQVYCSARCQVVTERRSGQLKMQPAS